MAYRRLSFLFAIACAVVMLAGGAGAKTLRVAPHSDLKIVDPIWTTALISVHHGYMVYDTLFALDGKLDPQPQMVERRQTAPTNDLDLHAARRGSVA
jgi:peptide/nickel transport system substrate-binding protein